MGLQANWVALDESALGNVTGVGSALQCGQVLLVRSGSEVVHHAVNDGTHAKVHH